MENNMVISRARRVRSRLFAIIISAVMLLSSLFCTTVVNAAGSIDWGTAVKVTQNKQVVDSITMNGKTVKALYAPRANISDYDSDATYCCAAFVKRFYSTVYGIDVWNLYPGNTPSASSGYFYKTDSPKAGDIAANSEHWAIVRSTGNGGVKLIEQNAWNTKYTSAMVGRTLYSGSGYWYWRWSGADSSNSSSNKTTTTKKASPGFSLSLNAVQTGSNNAVIKATVSNPKKIKVTKVGCYIYDANGKKIKKYTESCSRNESTFYVWYDIKAELGITLKSKTTYKYKIFVVYDGKEYCSKTGSFKTK